MVADGARLEITVGVEPGDPRAQEVRLDSIEVEACMLVAACDGQTRRLRVTVRGAVQSVGFRSFVYRLATELGLTGWVRNSTQGMCLEVEGACDTLQRFLPHLTADRPPRAAIYSLGSAFLNPCGYKDFVIQPSHADGAKTAVVLPDIATCADCRREGLRSPQPPLPVPLYQLLTVSLSSAPLVWRDRAVPHKTCPPTPSRVPRHRSTRETQPSSILRRLSRPHWPSPRRYGGLLLNPGPQPSLRAQGGRQQRRAAGEATRTSRFLYPHRYMSP